MRVTPPGTRMSSELDWFWPVTTRPAGIAAGEMSTGSLPSASTAITYSTVAPTITVVSEKKTSTST
jgi:hypothetical protein